MISVTQGFQLPNAETELPPMQLGEVVLKTARYAEMKDWYRQMLGLAPFREHKREGAATPGAAIAMCFFRLQFEYPYQQMVVLFEVPGTSDRPSSNDPGLHHMQLRNVSRAVLAERYRRLARAGIGPQRAMDHGPSTSFYYRDPDYNVVEISASNFDSGAEMLASFDAESYLRSPSGKSVEPEAFAKLHLA